MELTFLLKYYVKMEGFTSPLHLDVLEMTSLFSLLVLNVKVLDTV